LFAGIKPNISAMRPVEFAPEEIINAGHELRAAARNITGFALRQKIGGGSPPRLKQVWDEYLNSQVAVKIDPVVELPVEVAEEVASVTKALADRLMGMAVEVNNKAVKAAERHVAEIIRSTGEHREQAERELADASQTVEDLETKLDEAKENAEELGNRLAETQTEHQAQAVKFAQVSERLALIEEERNRYEQQADQMRNERDTAREDAAKLRGLVEGLQAQVKDFMQALGSR
jgi:colicin import membrane protein